MNWPTKRYSIIYADPPWSYADKALAGNRGACCKYPVMSIEDICALPVKELAEPDCALFIWVTAPKLNEVMQVINAWGFQYKTKAFCWVKRNKIEPSWFWGMGRWTRANSEDCLIATKGNPKRLSAAVHQIIESPIQEHSKKPEETRDRIVKLMGELPRIELFARQQAHGWDAWGNQVGQPELTIEPAAE